MEVANLPGAAVGLEEGADPLPDTGGELREAGAGVGDDLGDQLPRLVGDGNQDVQSLLYHTSYIGL